MPNLSWNLNTMTNMSERNVLINQGHGSLPDLVLGRVIIIYVYFFLINQWLFLVPLKGGRDYIIPQLAVYTTYIPLIYCLLGGYIIPTTF